MKKIILTCMIIVVSLLVVSGYRDKEQMKLELYFVDSSMQRLIASDFYAEARDSADAARIVIDELLKGRDSNDKIVRIMPDVKNGLTVRVKNQTAFVNISREFQRKHSAMRHHEVLTIYQIVNSLASIDGIVNVKFTIDNKEEKDFKGFCDMRETFIPDYYI